MTVNGQQVPGPLLSERARLRQRALQRMVDTIQADGEAGSTAIILTAKHGQSPQNNSQLQRIDDGPIIAGVNAAWAATHPSNQTLVVQEADDDGCCGGCPTARRRRPTSSSTTCGRTPPRRSTTRARRSPSSTPVWSRSSPARGRRTSSACRTVRAAPPGRVRDRAGRHDLHDRLEDRRARRRQPGRPRRAAGRLRAGRRAPVTSDKWVETTQVAPTILQLLGLDPDALQAVQIEEHPGPARNQVGAYLSQPGRCRTPPRPRALRPAGLRRGACA